MLNNALGHIYVAVNSSLHSILRYRECFYESLVLKFGVILGDFCVYNSDIRSSASGNSDYFLGKFFELTSKHLGID